MQLNKFIAHSGLCSRRNAVTLIIQGRVTINGEVIYEPGFQVIDGMVIVVNGKEIKPEKKVYILLNKPKNYVTTSSDEFNRKTVLDLLGTQFKERLYPVGRLDRNTTGLLILTNDGMFAQQLAHPKYNVPKEYYAVLDQPLLHEHLMSLKAGVRLSDGLVTLDHVYLIPNKSRYHVKVKLHSGKYHVVRRVFKELGYNIVKLDRVGYAHLTKKGLTLGQWRLLKQSEIKELQLLSQPSDKKI